MEKINPAIEQANETSADDARRDERSSEIRSLKDLEMVLVGGGGDGTPCWG